MKKNIVISFMFLLVFVLAAFLLINHSSKNLPVQDVNQAINNVQNTPPDTNGADIKYVKIGGVEVKVDVATTDAEKEQGLSGRPSLAPNTGMLFVFPQGGKYLFWMKDMNFAIDMIWITPDMKVGYIQKDATPDSYKKQPPETFGPGLIDPDAQYVLEINSGFSAENNLKVGDTVEFLYQ